MRLFMRRGWSAIAGIFALSLSGAGLMAHATAADTSAKAAGVPFSAAQAKRGEDAYIDNCVMCHGYELNDGEFGPPIKGNFFQKKWTGKTLGELFTKTVMTMPQSNPDSLDPDTYADIMAYVFEKNGLKPGKKPMPTDAGKLDKIPLPW